MMPGHYFLAPAIEPILSALRETVHIRDYFFQQIATALVITFFVTIPIAMFLSAFAQPITLLLLGEQWDMAGLLLSCLAWLVVYWGGSLCDRNFAKTHAPHIDTINPSVLCDKYITRNNRSVVIVN